MAKIDVPRVGTVTVFSVVGRPRGAVPGSVPSLAELGHGSQRTSVNYSLVLANPDGMFDATIGGGADGWEDSSAGQRIDYILMNDDSSLDVKRARRVFTENDLGRVSDHVGIYAEFGIARAR
jgi:hypothetical protein